MHFLFAALLALQVSRADAIDPIAWLDSLQTAQAVTVEEYVIETYPRSSASEPIREYARGAYTKDELLLEIWSPQQHAAGAWTATGAGKLKTEALPIQVIHRRGETVQEKIFLTEAGTYKQFPDYQWLAPLKELQQEHLTRVYTEEVMKDPALANLSVAQKRDLVKTRVDEQAAKTDVSMLDGVPMPRARQKEACLTGSLYSPQLGASSHLKTLRKKFAQAVQAGKSQVDGTEVSVWKSPNENFYFDSRGLVLWETVQPSEDPKPDAPAEVLRSRYFKWEVVQPSTQQPTKAKEDVLK